MFVLSHSAVIVCTFHSKRMMQGADERRRIMADVEAHREGELRSTTTDDTRQEGKNDVTGQSDAGVVHERENEL